MTTRESVTFLMCRFSIIKAWFMPHQLTLVFMDKSKGNESPPSLTANGCIPASAPAPWTLVCTQFHIHLHFILSLSWQVFNSVVLSAFNHNYCFRGRRQEKINPSHLNFRHACVDCYFVSYSQFVFSFVTSLIVPDEWWCNSYRWMEGSFECNLRN